MDGKELVEGVVARMNAHADRLQGLDSDYVVELTGEGGGRFRLRVRNGQVGLVSEEDAPAKASVALATSDFSELLQERVSAMALFMQGKVRLQGDMSEAFKLESLLRS